MERFTVLFCFVFPVTQERSRTGTDPTLKGNSWLNTSWDEICLLCALGEIWLQLCVKVKSLSCAQLFVTLWTVAHQASPSMGFSRQGHWSGLPFSFPGDLPDPGIESRSPALQAEALTSEPPGKPQGTTEPQGSSCVYLSLNNRWTGQMREGRRSWVLQALL